jgi:hypothetical protein
MDCYRCECGTLCRPGAGAREFTCLDCGRVRAEVVAEAEPEAQPEPTRTRAVRTPEPQTEDAPACEQ